MTAPIPACPGNASIRTESRKFNPVLTGRPDHNAPAPSLRRLSERRLPMHKSLSPEIRGVVKNNALIADLKENGAVRFSLNDNRIVTARLKGS